MGPGWRHRLDRLAGRRRRAAARPWQHHPARCYAAGGLHRPRRDVRRAGAAWGAVRRQHHTPPEGAGPLDQDRLMRVGVPTEIKEDEYRVALTPAGARELREHGHDVLLQAGAGEGSAIPDEEYVAQAAQLLPDAGAVFGQSEMVLGGKEPQPGEVEMLR